MRQAWTLRGSMSVPGSQFPLPVCLLNRNSIRGSRIPNQYREHGQDTSHSSDSPVATLLVAWGTPQAQFNLPNRILSIGIVSPRAQNIHFATDPLTLTTDAQVAAYNSGANSIYARGIMRYRNTFGIPHWTTFCIQHAHGVPLDEFNFCQQGNTMDHNQEQNDPDTPPN